MYSRADELLAHLKKFIRNEFNRMGLMGFDELNVLNAQSTVNQLYTRLKDENQKVFQDAAKNAEQFALILIALMDKGYIGLNDVNTEEFERYLSGKRKPDTSKLASDGLIGTVAWLSGFLSQYNKTTGYLYESEADRKRMRYTEEILTAREYSDRGQYNKATEKSASLWYGQSEQYLMDTVDEATIETYKANGVQKVKWMTEQDDRVCDICKDMHGVVYPIDEVPEKPHRRCRCYLIPVSRVSEKT
jgi:SPP1 gp7 family putative phage head morphogenesis protein